MGVVWDGRRAIWDGMRWCGIGSGYSEGDGDWGEGGVG